MTTKANRYLQNELDRAAHYLRMVNDAYRSIEQAEELQKNRPSDEYLLLKHTISDFAGAAGNAEQLFEELMVRLDPDQPGYHGVGHMFQPIVRRQAAERLNRLRLDLLPTISAAEAGFVMPEGCEPWTDKTRWRDRDRSKGTGRSAA